MHEHMLPQDSPREELGKIANTMFATYGVRGVRLTMGLGKKTNYQIGRASCRERV